MDYLCLVYLDEAEQQKMPDKEWRSLNEECIAFSTKLTESGHRVAGEALEPTHTATTIRMRDGKVFTTDGPFAETKEQLAGFYYIQAKDLNEAIQIASRVPPARMGSIEVRPVRHLIRDRSKVRSKVGASS